ncbi:MAG: hypothetical protein IJW40_01535 [Clostridia bacterium]|nr:hypothetical protein [Clostridia bacterium]
MTNRDIYSVALSVLGEQAEDCADYEERAPALIGVAVTEYGKRDEAYRTANGVQNVDGTMTVVQSLDSDFPLSDCFAVAVCYRLAGMLVERENPDFATRCFSHAEASAERVLREQTPAEVHPIRPNC